MKNWLYIIHRIILLLLLLISLISTSEAVYEGTANANMMIRRYERKGEFGRAALWREAAVKCLDAISTPLAEITIEYCQNNGYLEMARKMKAEIVDTKVRRDAHLKRAGANWEKASESKAQLDAERVKIDKFIDEWVAHYPDKFYEFGIYRNIFRERTNDLKKQGQFADALLIEADASDMCARQYNDVTIRYFKDRAEAAEKVGDEDTARKAGTQLSAYQKVRDKHLQRSAMLRALAKQNPENWPAAADKVEIETPESKRRLTAEKVMKLVRQNEAIQQMLKDHKNIREFAWFQGFGWTVSYYSHGWGSLAIVFVDDETGSITDIMLSPGNLEEHIGDIKEDEEEAEKLRLSQEKVISIAMKHPKVKSYFREHPDAWTNAAYNWRYNCWVVEVGLGDREIGIVTVSDKTEAVLEVSLD